MSIAILERAGKSALAYQKRDGDAALPTVLFFGGFRSDMEGTKAAFLDKICAYRHQRYVRFDYSGHGKSGGRFEDGTIGGWLGDALDILDRVADGDVVIVGSSMGGWLGLLAAMARPGRVRAYIGLAAAPDFTRSIRERLSPEQTALLDTEGAFPLPNDYGDPYFITRTLIEEGDRHCILDGRITLDCPVRLIQGRLDTDVPWQVAERILGALTTPDKELHLIDDGDHRLSRPDDLALLERMVVELG